MWRGRVHLDGSREESKSSVGCEVTRQKTKVLYNCKEIKGRHISPMSIHTGRVIMPLLIQLYRGDKENLFMLWEICIF